MKIKMNMPLSLMLIAAFVLSACGAKATPTATPFATETPAGTETPTPEAPPVRFTIWADEAYVPALQELTDDVLEKYNLELIVATKPSIADEFEKSAPNGDGPDLVMFSHDQAGKFISDGMLAEVELGNKEADYSPKALDACTFDGKLYCLPYATENAGFFYNTDLVTTPPTTWDEVVATGGALKAAGKVEYIMSITGSTVELYPIFSSFGGYIFGKDESGKWNPEDVGLDSPGMIAGTKWVADNVTNGNLPSDWDAEKNRVLFESGKTPFIMDGPASLSRYQKAGVHYAIAKFPGGGSPLASTLGFFINAQSQNVLFARVLLAEYLATDDMMVKLYKAGQRMPAHLATLAKVDNADLKAFAEAGANADMVPSLSAMQYVWDNWQDAIGLVKDGKQDPESALKDAGGKIRALIKNPLTGMINVVGTYQTQIGCASDLQADCKTTAMTKGDDGKYHSGPFNLAAGDYEAKVALDGKMDTTYGVDGKAGGDNYKFTLANNGTVEFVYDPATNKLEIIVK